MRNYAYEGAIAPPVTPRLLEPSPTLGETVEADLIFEVD